MSDTIAQIERKLNLLELVREHPWPSLALAVGAGVALAGSGADTKAAAATLKATGGASSRLGDLLDVAAASAIAAASSVIEEHLDGYVSELKEAIGAPAKGGRRGVSGDGASGGDGAQGNGASRGSAEASPFDAEPGTPSRR
jgi:hypothetical protein